MRKIVVIAWHWYKGPFIQFTLYLSILHFEYTLSIFNTSLQVSQIRFVLNASPNVTIYSLSATHVYFRTVWGENELFKSAPKCKSGAHFQSWLNPWMGWLAFLSHINSPMKCVTFQKHCWIQLHSIHISLHESDGMLNDSAAFLE